MFLCLVIFNTIFLLKYRQYIFNDILVDGGWSGWSSYGDCSVTCGRGLKTRSRQCTSPPPSMGGLDCIGESVETTSCVESDCPGK